METGEKSPQGRNTGSQKKQQIFKKDAAALQTDEPVFRAAAVSAGVRAELFYGSDLQTFLRGRLEVYDGFTEGVFV